MSEGVRIAGPIRAAGDGGLIATLIATHAAPANSPTEATREPAPAEIRAAARAVGDLLTTQLGRGLIDLVPAYNSLLVLFDPATTTPATVRRLIRQALARSMRADTTDAQTIRLPVYYGEEVAWDLPTVAAEAGVSPQTVIAWHAQARYTVRAIGFAPGFAYLGGLDARLTLPRRTTPRVRVPTGAVAIADRHTAIYPAESPGGWHVLGRCPERLFDPQRDPPLPYALGDQVEFEPIDRERFLALNGQLDTPQ